MDLQAIKERLALTQKTWDNWLAELENDEKAAAYRSAQGSHVMHADIAALITRVEELEADTVRIAAIEAFRALAQDNTYGPGPNAAWKILGEALGMVSSTDEPQ